MPPPVVTYATRPWSPGPPPHAALGGAEPGHTTPRSRQQLIGRRPAHPVESSEVAVVGHDGGPLFDGQRGQMRVVDEVAAGPQLLDESAQDVDMAAAGGDQRRARRRQPVRDLADGPAGRQR